MSLLMTMQQEGYAQILTHTVATTPGRRAVRVHSKAHPGLPPTADRRVQVN